MSTYRLRTAGKAFVGTLYLAIQTEELQAMKEIYVTFSQKSGINWSAYGVNGFSNIDREHDRSRLSNWFSLDIVNHDLVLTLNNNDIQHKFITFNDIGTPQ